MLTPFEVCSIFVKVESKEPIGLDMAASWGAIQMDWTLIFVVLILWYILLRNWERNGVLDRWNATRVFGIILMVRSSRGLKILDKVAKPRKFWRFYGEISLWVCMISMLMVGLLMLLAFISTLISPPTTAPPSASEMVAIPGLNPMIPLGWGALAFVIALVIHEFGHGLQARAHGMRIRSFGLLQLGPLPLGAFAEPQYEELMNAPPRERMRMFAAGPATNIFAAFFCLIMIGGLASQFVITDENIHVRGIIQDQGAYDAGIEPWDTIESIDGKDIHGIDSFYTTMDDYSANDTVGIVVKHQDGTIENLTATFSDKYDYFIESGWIQCGENLCQGFNSVNVSKGDPFLGISGITNSAAGIDRLAGPLSPRWDGTVVQKAITVVPHTLSLMIIPFELQGVSMHPFEESILEADDDGLASLIGKSGLLFLTNLFFWLMWVNILLGFTNLIPMVPFDGGHLFRDFLRGLLKGVRNIGKKLKMWDINPMWIEHLSSKASSLSSFVLLGMILFILVIPYF
jgi:membrane-associated protease RseP (regulator of RpoE activity)